MIPGLKAIPAFNGAGSTGSGGGGGLTFTFVTYAASNSSAITVPAQAIEGDFAVLVDAAYRNSTGAIPAAVTPSGWTTQVSTGIAGTKSLRLMTSYRTMAAGLAGTSIAGMNSDFESKVLMLFRPSSSIITTTASSWNSQGTASDPTLQTVSASGVTTPLIVLAAAAAVQSSSVAFTTETPAMTNINNSTYPLALRIGYTIYNTSPSDQSIDTGDNGDNVLQSGYWRFT